MKRTLLLAAMAAVALTSCTKDQVVDVPQNEIGYKVVTDNTTKAKEVYCAEKMITVFDVWAKYTADNTATSPTWQKYFADETVEYNSTSTKWVSKTTRYWPDLTVNQELKFYAVAGPATIPSIMTKGTTSNETWNGDGTEPVIADFTPNTTVSEQEDLLYAVNTYNRDNVTSAAGKASLNFRHALSQIEFKAKNVSDHLHVTISAVQVGQVASKGTFTFPSVDTDENWTIHGNGAQTDADKEDNKHTTGQWTLLDKKADYKTDVQVLDNNTVAVINNNSTSVDLTVSNDKSDVSRSMLLLPNAVDTKGEVIPTVAWSPAESKSSFNGTYLAVKCTIYNMAGATYSNDDVVLHDGWAVIPVSFAWKPGKRYIYTFVFGNGNGGYNGDPENPSDPDVPTPGDDPVLIPIQYEVTVDDFDKVIMPDTEMDTKSL